MANVIKLKRGIDSAVDNLTLMDGEIALTTDTNRLYSARGAINQKIYYGTTAPDNALGRNGDLYIIIPPMSFTVYGITYQADRGMTWLEWCASAYNTIGMEASTDANYRAVYYEDSNQSVMRTVCNQDYSFVDPNDVIVANYDYVTFKEPI